MMHLPHAEVILTGIGPDVQISKIFFVPFPGQPLKLPAAYDLSVYILLSNQNADDPLILVADRRRILADSHALLSDCFQFPGGQPAFHSLIYRRLHFPQRHLSPDVLSVRRHPGTVRRGLGRHQRRAALIVKTVDKNIITGQLGDKRELALQLFQL